MVELYLQMPAMFNYYIEKNDLLFPYLDDEKIDYKVIFENNTMRINYYKNNVIVGTVFLEEALDE